MNLEQRIALRKRVLEEKKEQRAKAYENRLLREYDKAVKERHYMKMKMKGFWLHKNFGYDDDYIPGLDDGEGLQEIE